MIYALIHFIIHRLGMIGMADGLGPAIEAIRLAAEYINNNSSLLPDVAIDMYPPFLACLSFIIYFVSLFVYSLVVFFCFFDYADTLPHTPRRIPTLFLIHCITFKLLKSRDS